MKFTPVALVYALLVQTMAHGNDETNVETERPPNGLTWEEWHMQHEHALDSYDPLSFFNIHDMGAKGYLDDFDILTMYGLNRDEVIGDGDGLGKHDNSEAIDPEVKSNVVKHIMRLLDANDDTKITKDEYLKFAKGGGKFPDLGVGVGHHADFELEYEIHHWNKYHKDVDPDMKNIHKEDVEHEMLHHEHEIEHNAGKRSHEGMTVEKFEEMIRAAQIPGKYRA